MAYYLWLCLPHEEEALSYSLFLKFRDSAWVGGRSYGYWVLGNFSCISSSNINGMCDLKKVISSLAISPEP